MVEIGRENFPQHIHHQSAQGANCEGRQSTLKGWCTESINARLRVPMDSILTYPYCPCGVIRCDCIGNLMPLLQTFQKEPPTSCVNSEKLGGGGFQLNKKGPPIFREVVPGLPYDGAFRHSGNWMVTCCWD